MKTLQPHQIGLPVHTQLQPGTWICSFDSDDRHDGNYYFNCIEQETDNGFIADVSKIYYRSDPKGHHWNIFFKDGIRNINNLNGIDRFFSYIRDIIPYQPENAQAYEVFNKFGEKYGKRASPN